MPIIISHSACIAVPPILHMKAYTMVDCNICLIVGYSCIIPFHPSYVNIIYNSRLISYMLDCRLSFMYCPLPSSIYKHVQLYTLIHACDCQSSYTPPILHMHIIYVFEMPGKYVFMIL